MYPNIFGQNVTIELYYDFTLHTVYNKERIVCQTTQKKYTHVLILCEKKGIDRNLVEKSYSV